MKYSIVVLCVISTFVLMYDHQKIVMASKIDHRSVRSPQITTKYDNIDVDRILASRRLLLNYVMCLLDKGPCTAEGKELKKNIPDALANECAQCSEVQKKQAGKIFTYLLQYYRDYWYQLLDKYDKDGIYRKQYEQEDYDYSNLDEA